MAKNRRQKHKAAEKKHKRQHVSQPIATVGEFGSSDTGSAQLIEKSNPSEKDAENHSHLKYQDRADDNRTHIAFEAAYTVIAPTIITVALTFVTFFLQGKRPFLALLCGVLTWIAAGVSFAAFIHRHLVGKQHSRFIRRLWRGFAIWALLGSTGALLIYYQYLKPHDRSNGLKAETPRQQAAKLPETLHDYFDADFRNYYDFYNPDFLIMLEGQPTYHTEVRLVFDWQSRTKFLALYLPSSPYTRLACEVTLEGHQMIDRLLTDNIDMEAHFPGERGTELKDLQFSKRVFIYHEDPLMPSSIDDLTARYKAKGLDVKFRGVDYVLGRNKQAQLSGNQP